MGCCPTRAVLRIIPAISMAIVIIPNSAGMFNNIRTFFLKKCFFGPGIFVVGSTEKGCGFFNIAICCGWLASSCLVERNNLLHFSDDNYSFFFCSRLMGCGMVFANKTLPVTAFTTYLKRFRCQMGGNLSCETPGGTVIK